MKTNLKQIHDGWTDGYVLDKHSLSSVYLGDDEHGHPQFDTTRSEVGEALFQLKYRNDWAQVAPLAAALHDDIVPKFPHIGLIVPMPATNPRARQPVVEIAHALGALMSVPGFDGLLMKNNAGASSMKNLATKQDKQVALAGRFWVQDAIEGDGAWNALLVDDLFHTGASMEAACASLLTCAKISRVYAASLSWR